MAQIITTTFRFKRGTAARWAEVNPILDAGEPGFVYDENRLKIGDGVTRWNNLPYIDGKENVFNFNYVSDFPTIGDKNVIYKAEKEQSLYQFNSDTNQYEKLSDGTGTRRPPQHRAIGTEDVSCTCYPLPD
jgi:hypothetical protein